jgi:hypothetical protein
MDVRCKHTEWDVNQRTKSDMRPNYSDRHGTIYIDHAGLNLTVGDRVFGSDHSDIAGWIVQHLAQSNSGKEVGYR